MNLVRRDFLINSARALYGGLLTATLSGCVLPSVQEIFSSNGINKSRLTIMDISEPFDNWETSGTPLDMLTRALGSHSYKVSWKSDYQAHFLTQLYGHTGFWVFEIDHQRKIGPRDSVDATVVPTGSHLIFKRI